MTLDVGGVEAKLGAKVDRTGFDEFDAKMAAADRKTATATLKTKVDEPSTRRMEATGKRYEKAFGSIRKSMADARAEGTLFERFFQEIKVDAGVAAIAGAATAFQELGAGAIGLVSALAPLSGLLVAYPTLFGAIGQASGVVALSGINNLSLALHGNTAALQKLSPTAHDFYDTLQKLKPQYDKLRNSVQKPLFSGLDKGLQSAMKNFGPFRHIMADTAGVMGDLAKQFGAFLGQKGVGRDFRKIGDENAQVLGRMGTAGINVADALRHVLVEARPLLDWLSKMAVGWTKNLDAMAKGARSSGALTHFFEQTRHTLARVLDIAGNLGHVFMQVGKAAAPLGRWILKQLDGVTANLAAWSDTAGAKNGLAQYFQHAKKPLEEFAKLGGAAADSFFQLSEGPAITRFLKLFREELLPVLTELTKETLKTFSDPAMIEAFTNFIKLGGELLGFTKPMQLVIEGFGKLAGVLNGMFGGTGIVHEAGIDLFGLYSSIKLIGLMRGLSDLFGFGKGLDTLKKIPGVVPLVERLKSAFDSLRLAGMYAADAAGSWISGFTGKMKMAGGKVGDAIKAALTKGRVAVSAAYSVVSDFAGSIVSRFASSGLFQKLKPIFLKLAAQLGFTMSTTIAGEVAAGETIGTSLAGKLKASALATRMRGIGKWAGRGFIIGFALAFPLLIKQAYELGRKLGEILKKPFDEAKDAVKHFFTGTPLDSTQREQFATTLDQQGFTNVQFKGQHSIVATSPQGQQVQFRWSPKEGHFVLVGDDDVKANKKNADKQADDVKKAGQAADKAAREQAQKLRSDVTDQHQKTRDEVRKKLDGQKADVGDSYDRQHDLAKAAVLAQRDDVNDSYGEQATTVHDRSQQMQGAVSKSVASAADATHKGMAFIATTVNKALKAFGLDPVNFNVGGGSQDTGTGENPNAVQHGGAARGAVMAGYSRHDNRTIRVRGGEAILRPEDQIPTVDAAMRGMFGVGLFDYMAAGGSRMGFAKGGVTPGGGYAYPFPKSTVIGRTDMGVDVQNQAGIPVGSIGDGVVTSITNAFAPEYGAADQGIVYRLASEPKGYSPSSPYIYIYEGLNRSVGMGAKLTAGERIGSIASGYPGIEIGWAAGPSGGTLAAAAGTVAPESHFSPQGVSFRHFLDDLRSGKAVSGGATAERIKRVIVDGPDGPLKDVAQAALDRVRKGAVKYLAKKTPRGATSAGAPGGYISSTGGSVPKTIMSVLMGGGLDKSGAAAITGNAYQESTWNPDSIEGLWGFHSPPVSMVQLRAYASRQGKAWDDPALQTNFLLAHLAPGHEGYSQAFVNTLNSQPLATAVATFMTDWEVPAPATENLPRRIQGAEMALRAAGFARGGVVPGFADGGFPAMGQFLNPNLSLNVPSANAFGDSLAAGVTGPDFGSAINPFDATVLETQAKIAELTARLTEPTPSGYQPFKPPVKPSGYTPPKPGHGGRGSRSGAGQKIEETRSAQRRRGDNAHGGGGGGHGHGGHGGGNSPPGPSSYTPQSTAAAIKAKIKLLQNRLAWYSELSRQYAASPTYHGILSGIASSLMSGFGQLDTAAQFGTTTGVEAALSRLTPTPYTLPDSLNTYASGRIASIRRTLAISRVTSGVLGGFASGGVVGAGGGDPIVVPPPIVNVHPIFEGDAALMGLRMKQVVVEHATEQGQRAGLSRQTVSAPGRRATYGRRRAR